MSGKLRPYHSATFYWDMDGVKAVSLRDPTMTRFHTQKMGQRPILYTFMNTMCNFTKQDAADNALKHKGKVADFVTTHKRQRILL